LSNIGKLVKMIARFGYRCSNVWETCVSMLVKR